MEHTSRILVEDVGYIQTACEGSWVEIYGRHGELLAAGPVEPTLERLFGCDQTRSAAA
jgi:hypothetical protein